MSAYAASDEVVVYLINQTVNGTVERRLAARFILDCLRTYQTPEDLATCFHDPEDIAILDVAKDAQELATSLGLIR